MFSVAIDWYRLVKYNTVVKCIVICKREKDAGACFQQKGIIKKKEKCWSRCWTLGYTSSDIVKTRLVSIHSHLNVYVYSLVGNPWGESLFGRVSLNTLSNALTISNATVDVLPYESNPESNLRQQDYVCVTENNSQQESLDYIYIDGFISRNEYCRLNMKSGGVCIGIRNAPYYHSNWMDYYC